MTSGRAGARVDRWRNWRKHNPLALCLLILTLVVGGPATSVFAAYQNVTSTTTVTVQQVDLSEIEISNTYAGGNLVTATSDITLRLNSSLEEPYYYNTPYNQRIRYRIDVKVNTSNALTPATTMMSAAKYNNLEIVNIFNQDYNGEINYSIGELETDTGAGYKTWRIFISVSKDWGGRTGSQLPVWYIQLKWSGQAQYSSSTFTTNYKPTVTASVNFQTYRIQELSDFQPYASQNAGNIVDIENYVSALKDGLIDDQQAAGALDQANAAFVQDAAQLEQQQGVLENAADASVGAVNMNQINLIDTYSGSVSFWSQLIGQLPTVLGSLWYVFIFGLLLAFVLFVLRIRR